MTSQQWLNASYSSQSIWWHYMIITVPMVLKHPNIAFLLIGAGNNNNPVRGGSGTTGLALESGTVAVELTQIPNQPIQFNVSLAVFV